MLWGRYGLAFLLFSGVLGRGVGAAGQAVSPSLSMSVPAPQASLAGEFASLASRSGLIFVGQVISIDRGRGAVAITFTVEQTVLGAPGAQYVLREWAGLWPQGQSRYSVGQRALVFLHSPGAAGFSSPVDGAEGVVPVIVGGLNAPELLDIRRLSSALLRPVGTPLASEANGAIQLTQALPLIAAGLGAPGGLRPEPVRLPMPVHSGLSGSSLQGTTGQAGTNGGTATEPLPVHSPGSGFGVAGQGVRPVALAIAGGTHVSR